MSLHGDLLAQARFLVSHEPRRPRQASLRRAVSASYYALFHLLIHEATRMLVSGASLDTLRTLVARAFAHTTMNEACRASAATQLPPAVAAVVQGPVPRDLREVAQAFVDLQEARCEADYDLAHRISRSEAGALVDQTERAFAAWQRVRGGLTAKVFLASLLLWRGWRR
jgi:hypothetical protein